MNITNGIISEIVERMGNVFVTVEYGEGEVIKLLVDEGTTILNSNCEELMWSDLSEGAMIDARVSDAMTRSIPPQATAYLIRLMKEATSPMMGDVTIGRIWNIDRGNRSFDTITGQDISSLTRFNVPENARIMNRMGRPMDFSGLMIGMRVQVRHANFMTASIPPQTTAYEVRVQ